MKRNLGRFWEVLVFVTLAVGSSGHVLPRLIHIISALPLPFGSLFSSFVWNGKRARISSSKLFLDWDKGGLGLPNFEKYYIDINSRYPLIWAYNPNTELTAWGDMEIRVIDPKHVEDVKSPVISFSDIYKTHETLTGTAHLITHGAIPVSLRRRLGEISSSTDLFSDGNVTSFKQLKCKFDLISKDF